MWKTDENWVFTKIIDIKTTFPDKLGKFDKTDTLKIGIKPADVYSSLRALFLINLDWKQIEKCKHRCSIEIFNTLY